jgi:hypothetical protein
MNTKKLHIKFTDQYENLLLDTFIHHIDAVKSHTLCYYTDFSKSKSEIFRLIEEIKGILVTSEGVQILYESGASLLITRIRA